MKTKPKLRDVLNQGHEEFDKHALMVVLEELGYLRGVIEAIDEKLTVQNGSITKLKEKTNGYDLWLGKFGAGMAVVAVLFSFVVNFIVDFIKRWVGFHNGGM